MSGKMFTMEYKVGNFVKRTKVLETNMCAIRNNLGELIHMVKRMMPSMTNHQLGDQLFDPLQTLESLDHQVLIHALIVFCFVLFILNAINDIC